MKSLYYLVAASVVASLLCACGSPEEERITRYVKSDLTKDLKDPDSVQYRNVKGFKDADGRWTICGEINAKNGYGGYVGYERFYGIVEGRGADQKVRFTITEKQSAKIGIPFYKQPGC